MKDFILAHPIHIGGIIIFVELAMRMIPSKRPNSIAHFVGERISRIGYHLDKVLPQKLK
jgi:hypothetical protein